MQTPADAHDEKRQRNRSRKKKPRRNRTAIWSHDGTTLLAVLEGHITPDDINAARQLALRATAPQ
ncbi:hypothetical protein [Nonomuraea jabiensis]|uniref:hypothetical protein n=1 Tax=Nonomuraea jabiensis TaxID=882448 RepID=UPI003D70C414